METSEKYEAALKGLKKQLKEWEDSITKKCFYRLWNLQKYQLETHILFIEKVLVDVRAFEKRIVSLESEKEDLFLELKASREFDE